MIIGAFLSIILAAVQFVVGFLPTYPLPAGITNGIVTFWSYLNLFSYVIPVGTIAICFGIITTLYTAEMIWKAVHWAMRRLRH